MILKIKKSYKDQVFLGKTLILADMMHPWPNKATSLVTKPCLTTPGKWAIPDQTSMVFFKNIRKCFI